MHMEASSWVANDGYRGMAGKYPLADATYRQGYEWKHLAEEKTNLIVYAYELRYLVCFADRAGTRQEN